MSDSIKYVGMDDHKDTISVGVADEIGSEVRFYGKIANRPEAVRKMLRELAPDEHTHLVCWYEAGPCGYELYRLIESSGHTCSVAAPSLTPRKSGNRIKTDRRDGVTLARLARAGELTAVWVPDAAHETIRDLTRCREDAVGIQRQARQQLGAFLLRHGRHDESGKSKWTRAFDHWLDQQKFDDPVAEWVFSEYVQSVSSATERVERVKKQMEQVLATWELRGVVESLTALRGVDVIPAMTLVAELGDLRRFQSPRQLMSYLGLVPSEASSGSKTQRGSITKTGNGHARRLLIESSWSYRHPARMTTHMKKKASGASPAAKAIAWKAQQRLCKRYRTLVERGKRTVQACTAVARELCGFIWAIVKETWPTESLGPPVPSAEASEQRAPCPGESSTTL